MATASHPRRRWSSDMFQAGSRPRFAAVVGIVGVLLATVALSPFDEQVGRSTFGLLLVVPVVAAALIGGRWPAYLVAAMAGIAFAFRLPPVGSIRLLVFGDIAALIVFFIVAVVVTTLVSGRIDALNRLERDRAVLLRSVSHDLRTPLATIRGAATELLDSGEHPPEVHDRMLHLIDSEAQRLDRLVANLLDLSRIEANAMEPVRQPIDLAELAEVAAERVNERSTTAKVRPEIEADLPVVHADPTQLDQLMSNLLENAVRHSRAEDEVVLRVEVNGETMRIVVSDRGSGVTAEEAEAIFEPFRSGRLVGSSGVGLAICRAIAVAHGGTIGVDDNPSGGADFTVQLPVR